MSSSGNSPTCPSCGRPMILRIAKNGRYKGKQFYGCSGYPSCKEILNIDEISTISKQSEPQTFRKNFEEIKKPLLIQNRLESPQTFKFRSYSPSTQIKAFQNIAVPTALVKHLKRKLFALDRNKIDAFTQWRLDFPLYKENLSSEFDAPLSVIEKILLRGSIIPCSPSVEAFLLKTKNLDNESIKEYVSLIQRSENHPRNFSTFFKFDSEEEVFFYSHFIQNYFSNEKIYPWIIPQVSISNLTQNSIDSSSLQRVDFVINHPRIGKLVLEIDGNQHKSSTDSDTKRDSLLVSNGFDVIRVKTENELENNLLDCNKLIDGLNKIESIEIINPSENQILETILLIKYSFQFQVALLEAVKGGWLSLENGSSWNISVNPPSFFDNNQKFKEIIQISTNDFLSLIKNTIFLFTENEINIEPTLSFSSIKKISQINIQFGSLVETKNSLCPTFYISDVFLPFKVAQSSLSSQTRYIKNPKKDNVRYLLQYIFQKDDFLEGQWEAINRTLQGKDSIVLLPTGGGKTIAFQLASFLLPGICLVVDPLIALIEDQIDNLQDYGVDRAIGISSQLSQDERLSAIESFSRGQFLFCYVAPERLQMKDFRSALRAITAICPINLVAIDEAHCVSEWGHDFRVAYLNIARNARNYCEKDGVHPPILGLTGTASKSVLRDVRRELEITDFDSVITPRDFDRKELNFHILQCHSNEKYNRLLGVLTSLPSLFRESQNSFFAPNGEYSKTGLIFFPHVNGEFGINKGFDFVKNNFGDIVGLYSGKAPKGIDDTHWNEIKSFQADSFKNNEKTILSCTNAFGMGIDKPNIRFTIHMNLPGSIESFYQEAGRAGRDRNEAQCYIILSNDFPNRTKLLLDPSKPLEEVSQENEEVSFSESDDITRVLYFHINSFQGAQHEILEVKSLINKIGDLLVEKVVNIPFESESRRNLVEKAIHRLVIVGVVLDYTVNYSSEQFEIRISGKNSQENLDSYIYYISNYDKKLADQALRVASERLSLSHNEFVIFLVERLIFDFIYNIIELSRRRSLSEMLQACLADHSDEGIRTRILSYLELGHFSEILDAARESLEDLSEIIDQLVDEVNSPMDANELRGQTARMLEAYPNNPALLLIRSFAEVLSHDRNNEIVFENFKAFLSYSTAESGWGIKKSEVARISAVFIDKIPDDLLHLKQDLVVAVIEELKFDNDIARILIQQIDENSSYYICFLLMKNLQEKVNQIIKS